MSEINPRGGQTVCCPSCSNKFQITLESRFWGKVDVQGPDDCWPWTARTFSNGYGLFMVRSKPKRSGSVNRGAHRVAYELLVGAIPDGLHLDHLCRNRLCVNPAHLEPVTPRENVLRGIRAAQP